MAGRSIYWHDGMFMWPHHMQVEERFRSQELALHSQWNVHYSWGLRSIDLDLEALKNQRLVIRSLRARLKDGAMIESPADGPLPALDLKEALTQRDQVTVLLGVPLRKSNQPNVLGSKNRSELDSKTPGQQTRYLENPISVEDENTGEDLQLIQSRTFNCRLLLDTQDLAGYATLKILRVEKTPGNEAQVRLDVNYIPPLLACDAWRTLSQTILQDLYHRFGNRIEKLANQILTRNISFDTRNAGDNILLGQLSVLNEAYATLNTLAFAEGVHPLQAYLELCRIAGQLAIFSQARRVPELPKYDHDDLGFCYNRVIQQIENLVPVDSKCETRRFIGKQLRMQVALESLWLTPVYQMFVGVKSSLKPEEVVRLLTRARELDMKVGSADRVDVLFEKGLQGLDFRHADRVPRDLPAEAGLTYFQIQRESRKEEWLSIQNSKTLAIRFNQNKVKLNPQGTIEGQTEVSLITGPTTTTTMQFFLSFLPVNS